MARSKTEPPAASAKIAMEATRITNNTRVEEFMTETDIKRGLINWCNYSFDRFLTKKLRTIRISQVETFLLIRFSINAITISLALVKDRTVSTWYHKRYKHTRTYTEMILRFAGAYRSTDANRIWKRRGGNARYRASHWLVEWLKKFTCEFPRLTRILVEGGTNRIRAANAWPGTPQAGCAAQSRVDIVFTFLD